MQKGKQQYEILINYDGSLQIFASSEQEAVEIAKSISVNELIERSGGTWDIWAE